MAKNKDIESMLAEKPWEQLMGETVIQRTQSRAVNAREFRLSAHLPPVDSEIQSKFNEYIHKLGAQALQLQLSNEKELEIERNKHKNKSMEVGRLLRRKIKVRELEEGMLSIVMDQEWDTSGWSQDMIIAGCEALILIFYDPDSSASLDRKERAVYMLQKLISRHDTAEKYVRRNIEMMIGQAANRLIKNGRSAGQLDLLYVLHACRDKFQNDLSVFNFTGKAHEMMMLESRLAAILIQHSYRARLDRKKIRPIITYIEGFGTAEEMKAMRENVIFNRNKDLRFRWRLLHYASTRRMRNIIGGMRGPAHIGPVYTNLVLDIILSLVSDTAGIRATGNREDVVRSNGCVLLSSFIGCPEGPFAKSACQILMYISRAAESFFPIIINGSTKGAIKFLKHIKREIQQIPGADWKDKSSRAGKRAIEARCTFIDCIQFINQLAIHAAGVYRARHNYGYLKPEHKDVEAVNYCRITDPYKTHSSAEEIIKFVGLPGLMVEVVDSLINMKHITTMQFILQCVLSLSCGDCHANILKEITAFYGRAMLRIAELIEEEDVVISTLAMCIFMQLNTKESARGVMIAKGVNQALVPITKALSSDYLRQPYLKAMLVSCSFIRQSEWRTYDPQDIPEAMCDKEAIRKHIYLDLLKTMKNPSVEIADQLTIADLTVLPNDILTTLNMSKAALSIPTRNLGDFLCHPHDPNYFLSLPWDESCGTCTIFEGLTINPETALEVLSVASLNFLGKCLFQARYLFAADSLLDRELVLVMKGLAAAAFALANFCKHSKAQAKQIKTIIEGITDASVLDSACFFIGTLSVSHPALDEGLRRLQVHVGMSAIEFFDSYASMLLSLSVNTSLSQSQDLSVISQLAANELLNLSEAGRAVSHLIKTLKKVHGVGPQTTDKLDRMCQLLCKLTVIPAGADAAINDWKVFDALIAHLPTPLSGVGELGVFEENYMKGLGIMPCSMFDLCTNMVQQNDGKARCLVDGFLRRALDKFSILSSSSYNGTQKNGPETQNSPFRKDLLSCCKLIARSANYTHPKFGAANDLIFLPRYDIFKLLHSVISVKEYPRGDELISSAVHTICALSRDNTRANVEFERYDTIGLLKGELARLSEYTVESLSFVIEAIHNFASGYKTPYMREVFPTMREPLIKVNRLFPSLYKVVSECNWAMTKATEGTKEISEEDNPIEDFIRGRTSRIILDRYDVQKESDSDIPKATLDNSLLPSSRTDDGYDTQFDMSFTAPGSLKSSKSSTSKKIHEEFFEGGTRSCTSTPTSTSTKEFLRGDISKITTTEFEGKDSKQSISNMKNKNKLQSMMSASETMLPELGQSSAFLTLRSPSAGASPFKEPRRRKATENMKALPKLSAASTMTSPIKCFDIQELPELALTKPPQLPPKKKI